MSRVEVQKLVIQNVLDSVKSKIKPADYVGGRLAFQLGVEPLKRFAFAQHVALILEDCYREGQRDANTVSRRVADWVMESTPMSGVKTVTVSMPDWVWGRLASISDRRGVTVGDVIADQVLALVGERDRLGELSDAVSAAKRAGYRSPQRGRKGKAA